ncbi:MAG: hypothetical protein K9M11_00135 [Candidatus Pacebacteria bacterium]|nr:hypothetical protein [Candidatus Paceibacterota bacterium]
MIKNRAGLSSLNKQGITLLEVLLYIAIFTVLCVSVVYLYISISKAANDVKTSIKRAEIAFFVYEISRHKIDTQGPFTPDLLTVEDFSRVLKYYPNINMKEIQVELVDVNNSNSGNNNLAAVNQRAKITYKIAFKGVNRLSEKIFLHTFYIDLL